jgi:hypothetical protein
LSEYLIAADFAFWVFRNGSIAAINSLDLLSSAVRRLTELNHARNQDAVIAAFGQQRHKFAQFGL